MAVAPNTPLQTRREARRERTRMRGAPAGARHHGIGGTRIGRRQRQQFHQRRRAAVTRHAEPGCTVQRSQAPRRLVAVFPSGSEGNYPNRRSPRPFAGAGLGLQGGAPGVAQAPPGTAPTAASEGRGPKAYVLPPTNQRLLELLDSAFSSSRTRRTSAVLSRRVVDLDPPFSP